MSDPQTLHVTRNVIPGKLGVDLHLHRVHIPLVIYVTSYSLGSRRRAAVYMHCLQSPSLLNILQGGDPRFTEASWMRVRQGFALWHLKKIA